MRSTCMELEMLRLARLIKKTETMIVNNGISKSYYLDKNEEHDNIAIVNDGSYKAIYIGTIDDTENSPGYMCLHSSVNSKKKRLPSTKILCRLLIKVARREKLSVELEEARYWEKFGDMDKQLQYFSDVVCTFAGIYPHEPDNADDTTATNHISGTDCNCDKLAITIIDAWESDRDESGRKELVKGLGYLFDKFKKEEERKVISEVLVAMTGYSLATLLARSKDVSDEIVHEGSLVE